MKFTSAKQFYDFQEVLERCVGNVYLRSTFGDCYNLKSTLSQYVAFAALLGDHGDELELYCANREDEAMLLGFLKEHNELL